MTEALRVYRRTELQNADCLYRWNELYNRGTDDSSDYAIRGQAFAHIKHTYILSLVEHRVPADVDLARIAFVQGIAEHQTPERLIPELRELWFRHAEVFAVDLDRYVAAEEGGSEDGIAWTPDLVYAHPTELEIVDDKTYWTMLTEAEARADFQGRVYSRQARKRWPNFQTYRFTFFFVRFNKAVSVVYTNAELDQVDLEIAAAMTRLQVAEQTGSYPAVAGPSCRFCELVCPVTSTEKRLPVRLNVLQAPEVGAWVLTAEKAVKTFKKALKAFCAVNGPVLVGDVEFNNRPVEERKYPLQAVIDVLTAKGQMGAFEDPDLTISHSGLAKLFRAFPELETEMSPFLVTKTSFRFGAKRAGDDGGDE